MCIVAVGMAIGLIAAAILYFYPTIISKVGEREDGEQDLVLGKEATSSSNGFQQVNVTVKRPGACR